MEMRVDMTDSNGAKTYAKYSIFSVGDETSGFGLDVGGFSGPAGQLTH